MTQNFNPFDATAPIYGMGADRPRLRAAAPVRPGRTRRRSPYPWLATSYTWGAGGKSITFAIRQGVKWSDGQPITAADVVFTYST